MIRPSVLCVAVSAALACAAADAAPRDDARHAWRDYARARIAPTFSWVQAEQPKAPTAFSRFLDSQRSGFDVPRRDSDAVVRASAGFSFRNEQRSDTSALGLISRSRGPIAGDYVASSVDRRVGDSGQLSVSGILARQRFATDSFGLAPFGAAGTAAPVLEPLAGAERESATGGGVRLSFVDRIGDQVGIDLALQSRIEMDPFKSYRGVYSDPGDFDIPARAGFGLSYAPGPRLVVRGGVERVFYSGVAAFTSQALPTRLLSLLGDGSSPVFAWRDLTVYSLEASYLDHGGGEWNLRWTSRQQPAPSSDLLLRALEPEFTDLNLALSYSRDFGRFGQLLFATSYAPSRYFLGAAPYAQRELDGDSQVEFEAVWAVPFTF